MNEKKIDIKKMTLIALPVIISFLFFIFFFKKEEKSVNNTVDVLLIPDSESEKIPESKKEIYEQEKKEKRIKARESEQSQISSADFFNKLSDEENENNHLSNKEKQEKIDQLFSNTGNTAPKAFNNKAKSKRWETEQVEDPLEKYDFEKKKIHQSPEPYVKKTDKSDPPKEEERPIPVNVPGKRSRNNNLANNSDKNFEGNLIPAVIHSDQIVTNGSTVKMRLTAEFYVNEQKIPRNTFVYGIARINKERVDIEIRSIRCGNNYIPFNKQVLDPDGIKGLLINESAGNQMSKDVGSDAIDEAYDIATSGSGIVGSVLSAGKSVLKKKNSEKKANLKANSKIYLK